MRDQRRVELAALAVGDVDVRARQHVLLVLLGADAVEVPDVEQVRERHQQREEEEGDEPLPRLDHVGREHLQHDHEPAVREDGREGGARVHRQVLREPTRARGSR